MRAFIIFLWLAISFAGSVLAKGVLKTVTKFIPGGGMVSSLIDTITGNSMEDKVDRIDKRQQTSLDRIREIAHDALETKRKIEDIHYFKKRAIEEAQFLAEGLRKGDTRKFLGAILAEGLSIPINPAEYIPDIPEAKQLKENLDWDLSMEKGTLRGGGYLLGSTRSALMSTGLFKTKPKQFEEVYDKAITYEGKIEKAIKAKRVAMVKIYKAEADRLEKELRLLERTKGKQGLTVSDVMQMEIAMLPISLTINWWAMTLNTAALKCRCLIKE